MRVKLNRLFLMATLCAACGGGGDGDQAGPDGGAVGGGDPAEIDPCQLVTEEDATALFDEPATRDQGSDTVDPAFLGDCLWTWEAPDNSNELLAIYVWDNESGYYYSADEGAEPLAIGEEGFVKVDEFAGVDIGWRQDGLALYLSFFTIGPMVPAASSKVEEVKALALEASARL